jgi:hypothetical protein
MVLLLRFATLLPEFDGRSGLTESLIPDDVASVVTH